jgi:riboflavin kinase/FMN adenylyltransferase
MQRFQSLQSAQLQNSWLTIGIFDGVHLGHREIIRQLVEGARASQSPAVVLTFHPHPAVVLGGRELKCLTTLEERAELLASLGVDAIITQTFSREFANQTAEDFMADLKQHTGLRQLLVGYDTALGRNRAGTVERLTEIGNTLDYSVRPVSAIRLSGEIISSTAIRQHIAAGEMRLAASKLGQPYSASGPVIPGDGRGRTIGIPTANVDVPEGKILPPNGVYACWASVDGQKYRAMVNIGVRPTFTDGVVTPRVEAHLLEYQSDLYGKTMRLEFIEYLRGEQKFASIDALISQIRADIERGKALLA